LAAPYAVGLVFLVLAPTLVTIGLAFTEFDLVRDARWIGGDNFDELVDDDVFRAAVRNSIVYALLATPLRLAGALGLALGLHRWRRGVVARRAGVLLPSIVPDAAYAMVWIWLVNPLYGPLNLVLGELGLPEPAWTTDPTAAMAAVVLMGGWQIGEGFLVCLAVRQQVPVELEELAAIEGAGSWQRFRLVILPLMGPTLVLLALRDTVFAFQSSFVPALLVTGGGPPPHATTFVPLFVYRTGFEYLRYGYAAAATVVMLVVTAGVLVVQWRLVARWRHAASPRRPA
jgi:multiple sugar transport system permease protein